MPRRTHRRSNGQHGKKLKRRRHWHRKWNSPGMKQAVRWLASH